MILMVNNKEEEENPPKRILIWIQNDVGKFEIVPRKNTHITYISTQYQIGQNILKQTTRKISTPLQCKLRYMREHVNNFIDNYVKTSICKQYDDNNS